jgi:hypothetical protein
MDEPEAQDGASDEREEDEGEMPVPRRGHWKY